MRYVIVLLVTMFCNTGAEGRTVRHPLFERIMQLNPKLDREYAMQLSNSIHRGARAHGVDPYLSIAILMQESSLLNRNTFRTETTTTKQCSMGECTKVVTEVHRAVDLSVAQINVYTALAYGLDIERLFLLDLEYAIEAHFVILVDKQRQCSQLEAESWTCYHSSTEHLRLRYLAAVSRYLPDTTVYSH